MSSLPSSSILLTSLFSLLTLTVACGGSIDSVTSDPAGHGKPPSSSSSGDVVVGGGGGGGGGNCTAAPSCDRGDSPVSGRPECLQGSCYERSLCGQTIWCTGMITCEARPSCRPGTTEVEACRKGTVCLTETLCGTTIHCEENVAHCLGYPSCNRGHTEVPSSAHCLQDDAVCYASSLCGHTIWCTGPIAPDPLPPPPK